MILFVVSLFFYVWGELKFVVIMIVFIIMNYIFGLLVDRYRESKIKVKVFLVLMCVYNIGVLFIFKYLVFVLRNISEFISIELIIFSIVLFIGILFFIF